MTAGRIDRGSFNGVPLDGLTYVLLLQWPGEIADGKGKEQVIIDERADADQREAIRKITHGEATAPGATHFFVYNSTMSEVLETLYAPIELDIDVAARRASVRVPDLIESEATPIVDPNSGEEFRAGFSLPNGFQMTSAEIATGRTESKAGITLDLSGSHAHLADLHMNQDGVIR